MTKKGKKVSTKTLVRMLVPIPFEEVTGYKTEEEAREASQVLPEDEKRNEKPKPSALSVGELSAILAAQMGFTPMLAADALKLAESRQLPTILEGITRAANKGRMSAFAESVSKETEAQLKALGYAVETWQNGWAVSWAPKENE